MFGKCSQVAVIGAGISGLTAAHLLQRRYHVTLFESADRLGGHAHTHDITTRDGRTLSLDTAFITYNEHTYPLLTRLFAELRVPTQETALSISLRCDGCGWEYAGGNGPAGFFSRPSSGLNIRYLSTLGQIPLFLARANAFLRAEPPDSQVTLREFLANGHYTHYFIHHFVAPLVSIIWSCPPGQASDYPARHLFQSLKHHGVLSLRHTAGWRTVTGGSRRYVELIAQNLSAIRLTTPVRKILRVPTGIEVRDDADRGHLFDALVIATHPDQALSLLANPTPLERRVLGAFRYTTNEVLLHTDETVLPRRRNIMATWNYVQRSCSQIIGTVECSYDMNRLYRLNSQQRYFVTLNPSNRLASEKIIARMIYEHPTYSPETVSVQAMLPSLSDRQLAYAGAYHGWGFHEDGCRSGAEAARLLGADWHTVPTARGAF